MTDKYAVFGNPIAHSKSPQIHQQFAKQTEQDLVYTKEEVALDGFEQAVRDFSTEGGKGLNITVPFKEQAYQLVDQLSARARQAGAVNTLIIESNGMITGDNTDGIGLVNDLQQNLNWPLQGKRILLLGAGGAARGVIAPILAQNPAQVIIANRTASKAENLATAFTKQGNISACSLGDLPDKPVDIIINATSASLGGTAIDLPATLIDPHTCCYDMMYSKDLTEFLAWAKAQGASRLADGLGMLVEQAAFSFYLWRGKKPLTETIIKKLKSNA